MGSTYCTFELIEKIYILRKRLYQDAVLPGEIRYITMLTNVTVIGLIIK